MEDQARSVGCLHGALSTLALHVTFNYEHHILKSLKLHFIQNYWDNEGLVWGGGIWNQQRVIFGVLSVKVMEYFKLQ